MFMVNLLLKLLRVIFLTLNIIHSHCSKVGIIWKG